MDSALLFPYEKLRPEQERLVKDVELCLKEGKHLLAHAPTGLGKTIAALGPCLKYAIEHGKTVFFLTSRHTQHALAVQTLKDIKDAFNLKFTCCDLIAKKWMCCQPGSQQMQSGEFQEYCKSLRNEDVCEYYTNLREHGQTSSLAKKALLQIATKAPADTKTIIDVSRECHVCPYEIAALLAKEAQVVIADYNYIFNQHIRESFFKRADKKIEDCVIVVDEAHNLPGRCREMMSEKLSTFVLERAISEAKKYKHDEVEERLVAIVSVLKELDAQIEEGQEEGFVLKGEFTKALEKRFSYDQTQQQLAIFGNIILEEQKQSFVSVVAAFLASWKGSDAGYCRSILRVAGKQGPQLTLRYTCLDPSLITRQVFQDCENSILMSGTLTPPEMYADLLGLKNYEIKQYVDPFTEEHRLNLVIEDVTTKFTYRNAEQYEQIASICADIVKAVPGNTLLFFPSYSLRNDVKKYFDQLCTRLILTEVPGMSKEQKAAMLDKFRGARERGAALLAVTGGSFGEGIDLPGDDLKCVVVVGVPLQKPDLETKDLISYYDDKYGEGMNYGYIYPAITKTMQNAGRCIRSETDRGVVVFMDARYTWEHYAKCFPPEWKMQITKRWSERVRSFFA
ncbi:MAG: ATP-dependent DNA helicase [Nanoarchaeota archaeon]|nr:ATP-dependent DNA helicase [Nanoarchaeota archaeon]